MADESKIFYRVIVHGEEGLATIQKMNGQFVKTKVPVEELNQTLSKLNGTLSLTTNEAGRQMAKFKRLRSGVQINSKEYQNLTKSMSMYQKQIDMSTGATGSASSAAMELGRVISDMPYGIRGVANNLSQFASQMAYSTKSTGSFKLAVKGLFSALTGPLGILLAIQAVIAALDFFAGGQSKSKEATDGNTESIKKQITPLKKLLNLYSSLKKVLFTSKDNEAINAFNNNFLSLDETVKVLTRNFSEFKNAYDKLSKDDKKNKQSVEALVKGYGELLELRELEEKQVSRMSVLRRDVDKKGRTISRNGLTFLRAEAKELDSLETSYIKTQKRLIKLEDFFSKSKNGDDKGETKLLEFEPFEEAAKTYEDELSKLNEKTELLDAKSEVEKLEVKKKYHLARLEAQHTEHTEKYEQTAAEYRAELELFFNQQIALGEMSRKDADKRLAIFDSNTKTQIRQSEESFNVLMDITKSYYNNRITEANFAGQKLIGDGKTQAQKEQEDLIKHLGRKAELYKSYSDTVKDVLSGIGDFVSAEFERELVVEENRNNEANTLLNNRLLNENLSKDQRANIQNQIAINDEKLRVKKEQIARKQFNVEKAFKIGMAIADTASSALKAYSSQLSPFDLTSPIRALAAAKVATAFGLANVAMIARTKFQSSPPSTPANASLGSSGGASATERADPSFNIVGRSNENLLINAIQAQFDKPLKAYVVSRDVTNQQQLDGMIVGQAGT